MKRIIALFTMFCLTLSIITINTSKVYAANIVNKTYKITVKDSSGNLMPNTWVLIVMPKGNFINWGVTDSSGFIQFDNVPVSDDTVISNREVDIYYSQEYYSHHIQSTYPNTSSGVNDVITTNLTLDNGSKYIAQVTYKSTNTPVIPGINVQVKSKFTLGNLGVPVPQAFYDYVIGQYSKSGVTDATDQVVFQLDTFNNFDVTYTKDDYNFTLSNDGYPSFGDSIRYYTRGIYIAPKGSVTIKYQDENSNDIAAPDVYSNLDVSSALNPYTYNAKSFPGYSLNDSSSKAAILTAADKDQTLIFNYQKIKGSVTVKYQDENNNDIVTPDVISNLDLGSYTENAKSFPGYTLNDSNSKAVTLIDGNADQTIIFKYQTYIPPIVKGSITVKYQDENNNNIAAPDVISNLSLGIYTENAKSFQGYTLNDSNSKTVILTDSNADQTIIFGYKKIKGSITVKYQDENNNDIGAPNVISNLDLGSYTENAKSFQGYTLNDTNSKAVTLTDSNKNQTIIFNYKKNEAPKPIIKGSYTIQYKDQDGNILEQDVKSNLDLSKYTEYAKSYSGYTLNDDNSKDVTLTESNPNQSIIFNYKKNETPKPIIKGSYKVQYKDQDGKLIEPETIKANLKLERYTEQAKTFPGYALNDEDSKTIELSETNKDQVIIFAYKKITGIIEGTVTDIDGKPLKGVRVELHSNPQYTLTDENGHYKIVDVELGDHVIRISDTNYSSIKEFRISVAVDENNKPVTKVIDGSSTPSQDLNLSQDSNRRIVDFVVVPTSNKPQEKLPQTGSSLDFKYLMLIGFIICIGGMLFMKKSNKRNNKMMNMGERLK